MRDYSVSPVSNIYLNGKAAQLRVLPGAFQWNSISNERKKKDLETTHPAVADRELSSDAGRVSSPPETGGQADNELRS